MSNPLPPEVLPLRPAVPPPFPDCPIVDDDPIKAVLDHDAWLVNVGWWVSRWGHTLPAEERAFWERVSVSPAEVEAAEARIARDTARARAQHEEYLRQKALGPRRISPTK